MTTTLGNPGSSFPHNLSVLRRRLARVRLPQAAKSAPIAEPLTMAAVTVGFFLLVFSSMAFVDLAAFELGKGLPRDGKVFFRFITRFGKSDWLLIPSGVFGLALLAKNFDRLRPDLAAAWTEIGAAIFFFFVAVAGSGLTTNIIKILVGRTRPSRFKSDGYLAFDPVVFDSYQWSFPSGHATTAAAAATVLILIVRRINVFTVAVSLMAAVIAISRVPVKAHYASDVLAGVSVGIIVTYAIAWWLGRSGVVFQRQTDARLLPKTVAVKAVVARRGGLPALVSGLLAVGPGRSRPSGPVGDA